MEMEGRIFYLPGICGLGLSFEISGFSILYGMIAAFMWLMTTLFSMEYLAHDRKRRRYDLFSLATFAATEGIFFSADLYTTFVFFEVMSLASYVWVAQDERAESLRAAATYLAVAVIGGLVMLMGLFLLYHQTGTLAFEELYDSCQGKDVLAACVCMLVGFGAKAGAFPLHIWLPKAHPVAPATASALLSGILTKTGIFGILVISTRILPKDTLWGTLILTVGTVTMIAGAVLALFSVDFKRTLACSSVSQIGFILVGISMMVLLGEENAIAVHGTLLHMVNHSLFKLTLFLVAGVIFMNLHKLDLNEIRGFGRKKPLLAAIFLSGALGIGCVPLFSGYVSKTLLHESLVEYQELLREGAVSGAILGAGDLKAVEWMFLISGGMTVAYMCKLFVAVFIERNADAALQQSYETSKDPYMNRMSAGVLAVCGCLFPVFGIFAHGIMDRIGSMGQTFLGLSEAGEQISYFSAENLKGSLISIGIGAVIYLVIVRGWMMKTENGIRVYVNRWPRIWDLEDYLYRPVLLQILPSIFGGICLVLDQLVDLISRLQPIAAYAKGSFFDVVYDPVICFMKTNVYKREPVPLDMEEGNALTCALGRACNRIRDFLNLTIWRRTPCRKDFVHRFALAFEGFKENTGLIGRSLSYGLLVFCLGLCLTLVYLLVSMLAHV